MGTSSVTPPPGYTVESEQASPTPPPGYTIEQPAVQQTQPTVDLDTISDALEQEMKKAVGGVGEMVTAPAKHMKNAVVSLAKGNFSEAGTHFLNSIHAAEGGEIIDAQLQSSKAAKDRMMEAAKKGDALATAQHAAGVVPGASQVDQAMTEYQENPTTQGLIHVLATALPMILPGASRLAGKVKLGEAAAGEAVEAAPKPGIVKQVIKGEKVAQPSAQAALREAAGGAEGSLRESLAQPIAESEAKASALYKQIDETAGVDIKALNRKLQNTNKQLRQLTDTPEDQAMEARLEQSRTGIMDKLQEAGVDPKLMKQADAVYRQTRAMSDVEAKVLKNPDIVEGNAKFGTEETVNVDKAIKALERLQSSKYGPRVEQAFGKEGANQLMSKLYGAQRQGVHALKMQQVAKWVATIAGAGAAAKGAGTLVNAVTQ